MNNSIFSFSKIKQLATLTDLSKKGRNKTRRRENLTPQQEVERDGCGRKTAKHRGVAH